MVLQELHGGHLGVTQMKRSAHGVVWWPKVVDEIDSLIGSCSKCQVQQDSPPLAPLYSSTRPWSRLHIDYLGPFLGHMWLLIIDAHSKWMEVFQMSSTSSSATIQCLCDLFT